MTSVDEKQNIMQLPPQEKLVAVALKHIFEQIKVIEEQENKEVQDIHQSFFAKYKTIEEKSTAIISGAPLSAQDIQNSDKYFTPTEKPEAEQLAKDNKGIANYWFIVLLNFYGDDLKDLDKQLATALQSLSTNVFEDRFEIIFQFKANSYIQAGKITRKFLINDSTPAKTEGDKPVWIKTQKIEGILPLLMTDSENPEQVTQLFALAGVFVNQIVPYSLQFFLGATQDLEQEQGSQQEEEEEQKQVPNKKVKQ